MSANRTISIFGATGGSGLSILRLCLASGYHCTVLVRNPAKLLDLLSISEPPSNLKLVTGAVQDQAAVRRALLSSDGALVDMIISCVGMVGNFKLGSILHPFKDVEDLNICEQATMNILSAISDIKSDLHAGGSGQKDGTNSKEGPVVVVLSTTGISTAGRDIPLLMGPLYSLLKPPHKDKKAMEDVLQSSISQPWITIRPAFLIGDGKGESSGKKIRVGIEKDGRHEKLAIGYTIKREDVGSWIHEEIVQGDWMRWVGKAVTLTY